MCCDIRYDREERRVTLYTSHLSALSCSPVQTSPDQSRPEHSHRHSVIMLMRSKPVNILISILVIAKILLVTRTFFRRLNKTVKYLEVSDDVDIKEPFRIMNEGEVTVRLSPPPCTGEERVLMMISSGPSNVQSRARWREAISGSEGEREGERRLKVMFLVSTCQPDQKCEHDLEEEHHHHGDILQTSLLDGHRRLGYKILAGYVWTHLHCPGVDHVLKTDDNVVMDLSLVVEVSREKPPEDSVIVCGSGPPHRNMKTQRSSRPGMLGNWTADPAQLAQARVPDFCAGFLYLVTPRTAVRLAMAGIAVFGDFRPEISLIEDSLITGVLRQSLADVELDMLGPGLTNQVWLQLLSHCPWLTVAKLTFFDPAVISKTSDRSGVQYVGSVTQPAVWRFFLCLHLEVVLLAVENILDPGALWDICKR